MAKYINKETGEAVEAIQIKDISNKEQFKYYTNGYGILLRPRESLEDYIEGYSPMCPRQYELVYRKNGINYLSMEIVSDNEYIVKEKSRWFIICESGFKKEFEEHKVKSKPDMPTAKQIIQLHLNTDEYTKLIEEAKSTVAKLNNITKRLKNPTIETRHNSNDTEIILKPGEE